MRYTVIDISSSGISMLTAEQTETGWKTLSKERENISMLNYLDGRRLSERGIFKVCEQIAAFLDICRMTGADKCYLISTAAMRYIENYDEVGAAIRVRTGAEVNLIDGRTEAFCDYTANRAYSVCEDALLIDIGGASLELCDMTHPDREHMLSLDFGPLKLAKKFVEKIHPGPDAAHKIAHYVKKRLEKTGLSGFKTAVLVGASVGAIYDVYADYYGIKAEEQKLFKYKKLKKLTAYMLTSSDRTALILKNAPERINTIVTAMVVLKAVLKYFDCETIIVSEAGVKEGYLELMASGETAGIETPLKKSKSKPLTESAGQTDAPVADCENALTAQADVSVQAEEANAQPPTVRRG